MCARPPFPSASEHGLGAEDGAARGPGLARLLGYPETGPNRLFQASPWGEIGPEQGVRVTGGVRLTARLPME